MCRLRVCQLKTWKIYISIKGVISCCRNGIRNQRFTVLYSIVRVVAMEIQCLCYYDQVKKMALDLMLVQLETLSF